MSIYVVAEHESELKSKRLMPTDLACYEAIRRENNSKLISRFAWVVRRSNSDSLKSLTTLALVAFGGGFWGFRPVCLAMGLQISNPTRHPCKLPPTKTPDSRQRVASKRTQLCCKKRRRAVPRKFHTPLFLWQRCAGGVNI